VQEAKVPKVSVIIPTYNRSQMLKNTIQSVLQQTEQDLEIIVIDDGSTDDTSQVVESLSDGRIRYYYKTNSGAAGARNLGLSKCKGEFVAFLDSDDLWPENYIETMVSALSNEKDIGVAYSPITLTYTDGRIIKSYKRPEGKSGWITSELFRNSFIWPSAIVLRATVCKKFFFDEVLITSEDSDAFLRLSADTQFLFVPDVEAFHLLPDDSLSKNAGITCRRLLSLERFYFRLGGNKIVPAKIAKRKLSHACRKVAEHKRRTNARKAAIKLYQHAIRYWPYDLRLYLGLLKSFMRNANKDRQPDWHLPEPLGEPNTANRFL
jgi:glycosyltransferase involved in cell wall biosynthesis